MLIKSLDPEAGLVNGTRGVVHALAGGAQRYPEVHFTNGQKRVIRPEEWSVSLGGAVVATRTQVPLELGWALSIHKSQGMTLTSVEVSLGRVFEFGQAYVALSRARSLEGLSLVDKVTAETVKADPQVTDFYATLTGSHALDVGAAAGTESSGAAALEHASRVVRQKRSFSAREAVPGSEPRKAFADISNSAHETAAAPAERRHGSGCTPQKKKPSSVGASRRAAVKLEF